MCELFCNCNGNPPLPSSLYPFLDKSRTSKDPAAVAPSPPHVRMSNGKWELERRKVRLGPPPPPPLLLLPPPKANVSTTRVGRRSSFPNSREKVASRGNLKNFKKCAEILRERFPVYFWNSLVIHCEEMPFLAGYLPTLLLGRTAVNCLNICYYLSNLWK